jgi:polygalacturonase
MAGPEALALAGAGVGPRAPTSGGPAVFDVTRFGAVGDGRTLCTRTLQRAIDACAATSGGVVLVPPGRYLTGALMLRSRVNIHLSAGATLLASQRPQDFPAIKGRDEGIERTLHSSLLTGFDLERVAITGQGVLDGQGAPWWEAHIATWKMRTDAHLPRESENPAGAPLRWPRPRVISLIRCHDVLVDGLLIKDTPFYAIHLTYCEDVLVRGVTTQQAIDAHNTAVVIDSSKRVTIAGCRLTHGGDAIGIKSGYNEDGRRVGISSEDILIADCQMYHLGSSGVAIGSETAGGIRNLVITDCVIDQSRNAVHIRSPRGRGGTVENIRMTNVVIDRVQECAIRISHFFDSVRMGALKDSVRRNLETARSRSAPVDEGTPAFRNFTFSGLTVARAQQMALIEGLPERPIRGLVFQDIEASELKHGIACSLAAQMTISNLTVGTLEAPAVDAREVEGLEIHRLKVPQPCQEAPAVWLENASRVFIHGCHVGAPSPGYQWLRQEQSSRVTLANNDVPPSPPTR